MMKIKSSNAIIVILVIIGLGLLGYNLLNMSKSESFVPWNNENVRETDPVDLKRAQTDVVPIFAQIVREDATKLQMSYTNFKDTPIFEQESKAIVDYVLTRINKTGTRAFTSLDPISTKKEQTLDPEDRGVVTRWTVNIFIQEANKHKVHSWSMNINFVLLQKGNVIKVVKLEPITDMFYDKSIVKGFNTNDKFYRIMNKFHLNKPWKTSGSVDGKDAIMSDEESAGLLQQWKSQIGNSTDYACFDDNSTPTVPRVKDNTNNIVYDNEQAIAGKMLPEVAIVARDQQNCVATQGTWDKPVENDSECGFYRANKNYPNRLGGVKYHDNRCEMPVNTKLIGYRYASNDPIHKPYCYNCKDGVSGPGSWGPCCEEQMDDALYPNLGGNPDYAYPGDELERSQWKDVLAQRGLSWQKIPTHTKNILNKNQRQPVFNNIVGQGPSI